MVGYCTILYSVLLGKPDSGLVEMSKDQVFYKGCASNQTIRRSEHIDIQIISFLYPSFSFPHHVCHLNTQSAERTNEQQRQSIIYNTFYEPQRYFIYQGPTLQNPPQIIPLPPNQRCNNTTSHRKRHYRQNKLSLVEILTKHIERITRRHSRPEYISAVRKH